MANLHTLFTREAAAAEGVDEKIHHEFNDLYERQQRHSEVQAQTPADIRQVGVELETQQTKCESCMRNDSKSLTMSF